MSFPDQVESPLRPGNVATLQRHLNTEPLIAAYRDRFGYNAFADLAGLSSIAVYEGQATSYQFFYPHTITGSEALYKAIEDFEWTYQEDQWEHEALLAYLDPSQHVLDVGCGRGAFLAKVFG